MAKQLQLAQTPLDGNNGQDLGHVKVNRLEENGTIWEQIGKDIDGKMAGGY
jgi:hypothetical protein